MPFADWLGCPAGHGERSKRRGTRRSELCPSRLPSPARRGYCPSGTAGMGVGSAPGGSVTALAARQPPGRTRRDTEGHGTSRARGQRGHRRPRRPHLRVRAVRGLPAASPPVPAAHGAQRRQQQVPPRRHAPAPRSLSRGGSGAGGAPSFTPDFSVSQLLFAPSPGRCTLPPGLSYAGGRASAPPWLPSARGASTAGPSDLCSYASPPGPAALFFHRAKFFSHRETGSRVSRAQHMLFDSGLPASQPLS